MKGIIFDADHTLYNPEAHRAYEEKFRFLSERTGVDEDKLSRTWKQVVKEMEGNNNPRLVYRKALIGKMLEEVGVENNEELAEEAYELFWETVVEDLEYEKGLRDMLERLCEQFDVLAIATDEFPEALHMKLHTVFDDPDTLFAEIVTPQDVGVMKPSPKFYRRILDHRGIAPEDAVMIGDSWDRDLKPAKDLGMTTIMVNADSSDEPLERESNGDPDPDYVVDSILEVEAVLEELA